ncbi:hypothetical protein [Paenibacillus chibensis]|uniref:hypothetical protein n=1 Tax=Paenibacillus chibensis TaxID=59846 RepID=UPI000FD706EE|nr:hypothetical protein [Paenibacillus chibensis]MEC0369994.1 hypothetical protein [Paenibacillus chibensis]
MLNVSITPNYRLTTDETDRSPANKQLVLQRRHLVDPTKSPAYKAEEHAAPPPIRETWKDVGYYPLNDVGLTAATKAAIMRDTDVNRAETLAEALRIYAEAVDEMTRVIDGCLTPKVCAQ